MGKIIAPQLDARTRPCNFHPHLKNKYVATDPYQRRWRSAHGGFSAKAETVREARAEAFVTMRARRWR